MVSTTYDTQAPVASSAIRSDVVRAHPATHPEQRDCLLRTEARNRQMTGIRFWIDDDWVHSAIPTLNRKLYVVSRFYRRAKGGSVVSICSGTVKFLNCALVELGQDDNGAAFSPPETATDSPKAAAMTSLVLLRNSELLTGCIRRAYRRSLQRFCSGSHHTPRSLHGSNPWSLKAPSRHDSATLRPPTASRCNAKVVWVMGQDLSLLVIDLEVFVYLVP